MTRCFWCNLKNPLYIKYHDDEWGRQRLDDKYLFEMLLLESFQAGLSWECVLNKREAFRVAFDGFDAEAISAYGEEKINALYQNSDIIRNRRKIESAVKNAQVFLLIADEFGSFEGYLREFWDGRVIYDSVSVSSPLSDKISSDLKRRGMRFVGTVVVQSFLQAIGIINAHTEECFLYTTGL